jgi:hypothetical protein
MAYNTATIRQIDPVNAQDLTRIVVEFTGNAGEPTIRREKYVSGDDTGLSLRQWAIAEATRLAGRKTIADGLSLGQSINLTPPVPPAPTAQEVWNAKVRRLYMFKQLGTTSGALATQITALQTDVEATIQAGWVASF